jgi:hypothetical protein
MRQELPFTRENRPWLTSDCIEAMNEQFMACISQFPEEDREALRKWATTKVELGYCLENREVMERCNQWGQLQAKPK